MIHKYKLNQTNIVLLNITQNYQKKIYIYICIKLSEKKIHNFINGISVRDRGNALDPQSHP